MYTNRRMFVVKRGKMQEAIEHFKTSDFPPDRLYGSGIGSGYLDSLVIEWDFESLGDYEAKARANAANPKWAPFQEKLNELTDTGGRCEILHRHM